MFVAEVFFVSQWFEQSWSHFESRLKYSKDCILYIHVYIYICIYIYMYVYIYIHIYIICMETPVLVVLMPIGRVVHMPELVEGNL